MTNNLAPQNDTMTLQFIDPTTGVVAANIALVSGATSNNGSFDNYTSVNFEKDFFTPSNKLAFTIEDDRATEIAYFMQRGWRIKLSINDKPNMVGYIFDYDLEYNRSGTKLTVKCKDLLEYMAQGSVFPNMGFDKQRTNFHFKKDDTLDYALRTIANAFEDVTGSTITTQVDDEASLTFATGFKVGVPIHGKTAKGRQKSLTSQLGHLTTPDKGESYLGYMVRLAKMAGCHLKLDNVDESIIHVKPPTYDRSEPSPFKLVHNYSKSGTGGTSANNVLSAHYHFGLDKQPSIVIVEANSRGDNQYYQSVIKGIAVNEMTGYYGPESKKNTGGASIVPGATATLVAGIQKSVATLIAGPLGVGYNLVPFNDKLYATRKQLAIDIDTEVCLPFYTVATSAHTVDEVTFAAAEMLAEAQDHYVEARFRVKGWTMPGTTSVWQPDMMVEITEEVFQDWAPTVFPMWIRQVNFIKTRGGGTETEILCTLPYTHNYEITK